MTEKVWETDDRVEDGNTPDGYDTGDVLAVGFEDVLGEIEGYTDLEAVLSSMRKSDPEVVPVLVGWDSGTKTICAPEYLRIEGERPVILAETEFYSAVLDGEDITIYSTIYRDNVWVGEGRWEGGRIVDCDAVLGDTPDESEKEYEALEDAIQERIG